MHVQHVNINEDNAKSLAERLSSKAEEVKAAAARTLNLSFPIRFDSIEAEVRFYVGFIFI